MGFWVTISFLHQFFRLFSLKICNVSLLALIVIFRVFFFSNFLVLSFRKKKSSSWICLFVLLNFVLFPRHFTQFHSFAVSGFIYLLITSYMPTNFLLESNHIKFLIPVQNPEVIDM